MTSVVSWIIRIIHSCVRMEQFDVANKIIFLYSYKYKDKNMTSLLNKLLIVKRNEILGNEFRTTKNN